MKLYDYKKFDTYWQKKWEENNLYETKRLPKEKKVYVLDMFPYPSGEGLHVGHPKGYIATDIYSRFKRMNGYDVLHPMGWDAFGLPAEQFALKHKVQPRVAVEKNIANFKQQLSHLGLDYDWKREVNTTDPEFYKWTQWIFTKLYEKGLAYESHEPINWCPTCKTGLANEDLNGNLCERCDSVVEKKPIRQWVLKITDYADRMIKDLDVLNWPEGIKTAQKNWIGRSEGAEFDFKLSLPVEESLKFEDKFIEDILVDKKTMTVRLDKKNLSKGSFFTIKNSQGSQVGVAVVENIRDKKFKDLDLNNPHGTSYHTKEEQLSAYKKYYGDNVENDSVFYEVYLKVIENTVRVFTTRPDTLFGATFLAISAELASTWFNDCVLSGGDVQEYITTTLEEMKKENDYSVVPEKTGIFSGVYVINPATEEKIPVWIANYVVGGVGTGALMAVPAHDERDFEFAKKYSLPIREVVCEVFGNSNTNAESRDIVKVLLKNEENKYAILRSSQGWYDLPGGGVDELSKEEAAIKEIKEETGFLDVQIGREIGRAFVYYTYKSNEFKKGTITLLEGTITSQFQQKQKLEEHESFVVEWKQLEEVLELLSKDKDPREQAIVSLLQEKQYNNDGIVINSGEYTFLSSQEARIKIIEKVGGTLTSTYKLKDWVFARQRYWGEPFPVVRDENGKVYMVDESELPVLLPLVDKYEPTGTGESPLAEIESWVNVSGYITEKGTFKQSPAGTNFYRETNTMPQWAGSSWYYLRFLDPHNSKALIDPVIEKAWGEVNVYVGGDHATRHLIYARFWHKFLYDIGVVSTNEPFARLEFLGFILAEDGRKMSKRWGNIINPDDVVSEYGADTLRVYEMFMAPFDQTASWSTSSIKGSDKFLDRVYALKEKISETSSVEVELHKTIKKVGEDIENFKFNTAVSSMMILVNSMESGSFTRGDYGSLLKLLAPFAPHIAEQVWHELGNETFIHKEMWPTYDEYKLVEGTVTLAIQIAGKMRGTIEITRDSEDSLVIEAVKNHEMYKKYVGENEPKKVIIVKNKIVNIVL